MSKLVSVIGLIVFVLNLVWGVLMLNTVDPTNIAFSVLNLFTAFMVAGTMTENL